MKNERKKVAQYLKVISKIEKVRSKNNVNWMDICRLALKSSPEEAIRLMKQINKFDDRISKLFKSIK